MLITVNVKNDMNDETCEMKFEVNDTDYKTIRPQFPGQSLYCYCVFDQTFTLDGVDEGTLKYFVNGKLVTNRSRGTI